MRTKLFVLFVVIFAVSNQVTICQSQVDIKEKHTLIYESLKDVYKEYSSDYMKALAFLIICIGWFITSDKSRKFFNEKRAVRISAVIALIVICMIHIRSQINAYFYSQHIFSDLMNLNYLDPKYYENSRITLEQLITNSIMNAVLFTVLILIILSLKKVTNK